MPACRFEILRLTYSKESEVWNKLQGIIRMQNNVILSELPMNSQLLLTLISNNVVRLSTAFNTVSTGSAAGTNLNSQ